MPRSNPEPSGLQHSLQAGGVSNHPWITPAAKQILIVEIEITYSISENQIGHDPVLGIAARREANH